MADISNQLWDKLTAQAQNEIRFARVHKKSKITNWQKNEDLYYGKKVPTKDSRANIELGRMQEFIHTLLSKTDNPLVFKYIKRKEAQLQRVKRLNALRQIDSNNDDWDIKDIAGKKQAYIYGRAIYSYFADSIDGYKPHLDNIDVYDFQIDPNAGGLDVEKAEYLGYYGVTKDEAQLKAGVEAGYYDKTEVKKLLQGKNTDRNEEDTNKLHRQQIISASTPTEERTESGSYKFWNWFTTYKGERYYLLMTENGAAIEICPLSEKFTPTKEFPRGAYPIWTWAPYPDLTEFWSPSPADYVREIFMAQNVAINQMYDNAEQINKPMRAVNVSMVENLTELKYQRDRLIKVKMADDVNKAVTVLQTPSINTPIEVFNLLESIQEKSSGVTAGSKGVSEDTKVGVYEGNQANAADRFGLINKSYTQGYKRFAKLYVIGVTDHLTKKVAVDMIGPNGIETEEVKRSDIFKKGDEFGVLVEASDAENAASAVDQKNKIGFLAANMQNPIQSPKKAYEFGAKVVGFTEEEIKQLLDTSNYGRAEIMAEAERDIEEILEGKKVKPNRAANVAYKQRFLDYMQDNEEHLTMQQFLALEQYINSCEEYVLRNAMREGNLMSQQVAGGAIAGELPLNPQQTPNVGLQQTSGQADLQGFQTV